MRKANLGIAAAAAAAALAAAYLGTAAFEREATLRATLACDWALGHKWTLERERAFVAMQAALGHFSFGEALAVDFYTTCYIDAEGHQGRE